MPDKLLEDDGIIYKSNARALFLAATSIRRDQSVSIKGRI